MTERYYTETHEWVRFLPDGTAEVGVSAYLVETEKKPAFINLCDEGDFLSAGDVAGDIEFFKGVEDVHAPVSGIVDAVNDALLLRPQMLEASPLTWLFRLRQVRQENPLIPEKDYLRLVRKETEHA